MDRRNFLSASLTASALSVAGAANADAQAPAAAEYYDFRRYQLVSGPGTRLTDNYFAGALIPALNRLGIGPVGAFSIYFGPDTPAYYLLLPSTKLETLVTADLELAKDPAFMKAAAPFWDAPGGATPFSNIESTLLRAFAGYPKLVVPAAVAKKEKRIYQLRQYVSPTNMDHVRKVEMFHHGEFGIFTKAGAAGVFYADALIGPRLPSLTYMLSFPDIAALAAREKFGADPDWKKLSNDPRFKLDPPTVSNVISIVLRPLPAIPPCGRSPIRSLCTTKHGLQVARSLTLPSRLCCGACIRETRHCVQGQALQGLRCPGVFSRPVERRKLEVVSRSKDT